METCGAILWDSIRPRLSRRIRQSVWHVYYPLPLVNEGEPGGRMRGWTSDGAPLRGNSRCWSGHVRRASACGLPDIGCDLGRHSCRAGPFFVLVLLGGAPLTLPAQAQNPKGVSRPDRPGYRGDMLFIRSARDAGGDHQIAGHVQHGAAHVEQPVDAHDDPDPLARHAYRLHEHND